VSAPVRQVVPLKPVAELLEWQLRGSCRGVLDDKVFFPERRTLATPGKKICADCPVLEECRQDALEHQEVWGTRGGMDQWERARLLGIKLGR